MEVVDIVLRSLSCSAEDLDLRDVFGMGGGGGGGGWRGLVFGRENEGM